MSNCTTTGRCTTCPAVPAEPPSPGYWEYSSSPGWNGGARSGQQLAVDGLRTRFQVGNAMGVVVGFARQGVFHPADTSAIEHGFYLFAGATGARRWAVMESGAVMTRDQSRSASAVFEIRRWRGRVRYLIDDVEVFVSGRPSVGPLIVGCSMYEVGDTVG